MPNQRPRILLIEDDASMRRSTQLLLQGRGFDVRAYAAADALLLDDEIALVACLVADYRLGRWNGISVLASLRSTGWQGPAILITAYATPELRRQAKEAGFAAFLEKPFSDNLLVTTIMRLTKPPSV